MRVMRARCNQNTVTAGCKYTDGFSCPTNSGETASNQQPGGQKQPEQRKTQTRGDASCHFAAQEAEFGSSSRVGEENFRHNRLASTVSAADRLPAFGPDPPALHPPPMKRAEIESKRREKNNPETLEAAFQAAELRSDMGRRPRVLALITKRPQIQSFKPGGSFYCTIKRL